jgi:hypothetical protein
MSGETRAERSLRIAKAVVALKARPGTVVVERDGMYITLPRLRCLEKGGEDGDPFDRAA